MKLREAIQLVFNNNNNLWLTPNEVWDAIKTSGIYHSDGESPERTVNSLMQRSALNTSNSIKNSIIFLERSTGRPAVYRLLKEYYTPVAPVVSNAPVLLEPAITTPVISNTQDTPIDEQRFRDLFEKSLINLRATEDKKHNGYVFDNQISAAKDIIFNFYSGKNRWCLLLAEMQSGKSGTFFSVPYIISRNQFLIDELKIGMSNNDINVFLLTGMKEKELTDQFMSDINIFTGMDLQKNVLDNNVMQKLIKNKDKWKDEEIKFIDSMKKNCLLLIDESHYGSDSTQVLYTFVEEILGIKPKGSNINLNQNNIYILSISATPMAEFLSKNDSQKIKLINGPAYYGISEMFENNKVRQAFPLKTDDGVNQFLDTILNIKENGYILVRSKNKDNILNIMRQRNLQIETVDYDQHSKSRLIGKLGINDLLKNKIDSKKIIFLKGLLRAGKRVDTSSVIMVHDTYDSKSDTTVQSLLGRCCGYNKNRDILIYCDLESAEAYRDWVESDFHRNHVPTSAKNIKKGSKSEVKKVSEFRIELDDTNSSIITHINEFSLCKNRETRLLLKLSLLRLFNQPNLNNYLDSTKYGTHYEMGTVYRIDKNIEKDKYRLQYEDCIGDVSIDINDLGKRIFHIAYDLVNKKAKLSCSIVEENRQKISINPKSYYA